MAESESAGVRFVDRRGSKSAHRTDTIADAVPQWNRAATFLSNSDGRLNFDAQSFRYAHK
jgi:hypothetical protein